MCEEITSGVRVCQEGKAARYRRALELACNGDADQVAYFVSEAGTAMDEERNAGVAIPQPGQESDHA